jgi:hypothetical protein
LQFQKSDRAASLTRAQYFLGQAGKPRPTGQRAAGQFAWQRGKSKHQFWLRIIKPECGNAESSSGIICQAVAKAGLSPAATREVKGLPRNSCADRPKRARKAPSAKVIRPWRSASTNSSAAAKAKTTKRSLLLRGSSLACKVTALGIIASDDLRRISLAKLNK